MQIEIPLPVDSAEGLMTVGAPVGIAAAALAAAYGVARHHRSRPGAYARTAKATWGKLTTTPALIVYVLVSVAAAAVGLDRIGATEAATEEAMPAARVWVQLLSGLVEGVLGLVLLGRWVTTPRGGVVTGPGIPTLAEVRAQLARVVENVPGLNLARVVAITPDRVQVEGNWSHPAAGQQNHLTSLVRSSGGDLVPGGEAPTNKDYPSRWTWTFAHPTVNCLAEMTDHQLKYPRG